MTKLAFIVLSVSAFLATTAVSVLAAEAKDKQAVPAEGGSGHSHFTKIPPTVPEIWTEIRKQEVNLAATVEKKDLGEAHDHAFAIRDLVKALPAKVPAAQKSLTEDSAKNIAKLAADIDKTAAAKAQKATEANVKKMTTAIAALDALLNPAGREK